MNTEVIVRGETLRLLPERAIYRPANRTLLVSDLHWGKAEVFQKSGVAVSSEQLVSDLERLSHAIANTSAERLIVLGDLIHARSGITPEVEATIRAWREQHRNLQMHLIRGNHDRNFQIPHSWGITCQDEDLEEPPFRLSHDESSAPHETSLLHVISGHIHPVVKLRSGHDSLRLPCFAIGKERTLLPAFSSFTGGQEVRPREWRRLFALTPERVIEV